MLFLLLLAPLLTRGPVLLGASADSVYVSWETSDKQAGGSVHYGLSTAYGITITDPAYTQHHHVQLTGLLPGTTYHYGIDSDAAAEDSVFHTAPVGPVGTPIKFIVYGDNRSNAVDHQKVVDSIRNEAGIAFLLHTGDMAQNYPFSGQDQWDQFFSVEHDLLRSNPFFPTVGNHETLDSLQSWSWFFSPPRFDPTASVSYYSTDWAQLHLVSLDTFDATGPNVDPKHDTISAAQFEWLKSDLDDALRRGQLIFVSLHHGAVSHATGPDAHGGSDLVRTQVIPELNARGVTAVFAGHDHIYERGCSDGMDYFVAGGGGAPLYPVADGGPDPTILALKSTLEYSVLTVTGRKVAGYTKDTQGYVIDTFDLPTQNCQHDAGVPAQPDGGSPDAGQADAGSTGTTPRGGSCGSAGAATLLSLLPLLWRRRRK